MEARTVLLPGKIHASAESGMDRKERQRFVANNYTQRLSYPKDICFGFAKLFAEQEPYSEVREVFPDWFLPAERFGVGLCERKGCVRYCLLKSHMRPALPPDSILVEVPMQRRTTSKGGKLKLRLEVTFLKQCGHTRGCYGSS